MVGLEIEHPRADDLAKVFAAMGDEVVVSKGPMPVISATIEGKFGPVVLS